MYHFKLHTGANGPIAEKALRNKDNGASIRTEYKLLSIKYICYMYKLTYFLVDDVGHSDIDITIAIEPQTRVR